MNHIETIKNVYAAFEKRNIPAILEHLADDVVFEYSPTTANIPWLAPRKGKVEAAGFFKDLEQIDITKFQVNDIVGNDNVAVGLVTITATVKATGKTITEIDEPHVWRFNKAGKIVAFRHAPDTYAQWKALQK